MSLADSMRQTASIVRRARVRLSVAIMATDQNIIALFEQEPVV